MGLRSAIRAFTRELKFSAAGPAIARNFGFAFGQSGAPTPREYDRLADEGFTKNSVVFRCVNLISEEAAAIPWQLFQGKGQNRTQIEDHPLLTLLEKPNIMSAGSAFFRAIYAFRLLSGNSYVEAVTTSRRGVGTETPTELWVHRPDRMKVKPGPRGIPEAYVYDSNGSKVVWPVNEFTGQSLLMHSKNFHPLNDWYGMSALEAAAFEVDQHNAAGQWNFSLLKNSARPSGAFVYMPGKDGIIMTLGDEEFSRLRAQIDEMAAGEYNAGRPVILEGGLDWRQIALTPTDMDWLKGRDMSARDIAMAYDVPPQLVGIEGSQTYANFEQAILSLYDSAVLPLVDSYKDDLNMWLSPMFGDDIFLDFDKDQIEALQPRRQKKWENVSQADFLTINEKRDALGFDKIEDPLADELWMDMGKAPMSIAGAPPLPPTTDPSRPNDDPPDEARMLLIAPPGGWPDCDLQMFEALAYGSNSIRRHRPALRNGSGGNSN